MGHNRVRANKSTYDTRSQQRQARREPTLTEQYMQLLFGKNQFGSDRPNWKWRGTGHYAYTATGRQAVGA